MNILILGSGRHGKDTVAEILRDYLGFKFESSSKAAYDIFIYDYFKGKYGYESLEEAYNDRHSHREELFKLISEYNTPDKTTLARGILKRTGMYVGMRCKEEVEACITDGIFDLIIWVDASERVEYVEGSDSMTIDKSYADVIIDNNGTKADLINKVCNLGTILRSSKGF